MTHQCIGIAVNVVRRLIGQVFALVKVIATMEYDLRVDRKYTEEDCQGCGDDPD